MRIGLFTESYDPIINGVSTSVKTLATHLGRTGHTPLIVTSCFPGYTDPPNPPWEIMRVPSWRTALNRDNPAAIPPLFGLPPHYCTLEVDVVHLQHPFGLGQQAMLYARRRKIPLIATFHTLYTQYLHYVPFLPRPVMTRILNAYLRGFYNRCDAVIVPSQHTGDILKSIGVQPERLRVVPTGVPAAPDVPSAEVSALRATLNLPSDQPVVLYVGRLAQEKNLTLLLNAFAQLITPICLLLVGSGPYQAALETEAERLGIASRVRFAGFVPHAQVAAYYALATVFAFPSITETQGVVLSEAQSFGLPCVVANGGGAPESVRPDVDALVVPAEVAPFRAALERLLTEASLRAAFSHAARTSPLRPTPEQMVAQIVDIYTR